MWCSLDVLLNLPFSLAIAYERLSPSIEQELYRVGVAYKVGDVELQLTAVVYSTAGP